MVENGAAIGGISPGRSINMAEEIILAAVIGAVAALVGAVVAGVFALISDCLKRRFEVWKLQTRLFLRSYDAYQSVRETGYRVHNEFERLKKTQFADSTDLRKKDLFVDTIKYRTALDRLPLVLPRRGKVYEKYWEAEKAARALIEGIIKVGVYTRRDALRLVEEKPGTHIIQATKTDAEMSQIYSDFLNLVPSVDPDDAMKTINDHRKAYLDLINEWFRGPG